VIDVGHGGKDTGAFGINGINCGITTCQ